MKQKENVTKTYERGTLYFLTQRYFRMLWVGGMALRDLINGPIISISQVLRGERQKEVKKWENEEEPRDILS